jgi:pimeloyl-ACP methyl ester carboxylesterase
LALAACLPAATACGADFHYVGFSEVQEAAAASDRPALAPAVQQPGSAPSLGPACSRDLSHGVVVAFSGGPPPELLPSDLTERFDEYITAVNGDPVVDRCSGGAGLAYKLLDKQKDPHIHQSRWADVCKAIQEQKPTGPVIIAGYSMGGAAAVSLARCLNESGKAVDLLITLDSVPTGDDLGNVYSVPPNVKLNVNLFQKPAYDLATFVVPFPFGHANKREDGGKPDNIFNAGVHFDEPLAAAHHRIIYDFSGGKRSGDNDYAKPFLLRDLTLAALKGAADEDGMKAQVVDSLARLAAVEKVEVSLSGAVDRDFPASND